MHEVCVMVPVHTDQPTRLELISFEQCCRVLQAHDIFLIAPEGLNLDAYGAISKIPKIIRIPVKWQSSLMNYNKLKLSNFFYGLFVDYSFLLTYELDAFVFEDKLHEWCNAGIDYIGAPWFEGYDKPADKLIGVGNSGFSLRRISVMRKMLKNFYYRDPKKYQVGNKEKLKALIQSPLYRVRNYSDENYTIQQAGFVHEDLVLAQMAKKFPDFKVATIEQAISFSFEANPALLYKLNGNRLPIGCHGWWKYGLDFWAPFINAFGYQLPAKLEEA